VSVRDFAEYVARLEDHGDRVALTSRTFLKVNRVTHRELRRRAYQTARFLAAQGVTRGERVMVMAPNAPEWIELLLGTELLGAVLVSVDAASTSATLRRFVDLTEPRLLFTSRYATPAETGVATRHLEDLESLIEPYESICPEGGPEAMTEWPGVIVFTSGTTADPKGVVLTQGNILSNIEGILARVDVGADWRMLSILPLSHMYGLTSELSLVSRGASVFYVPRVSPAGIAEALVDYRITLLVAIPELLSLMLDEIERTAAREGRAGLLALAMRAARRLPWRGRRLLLHSVLARLGGDLDLVVTGGAPIPADVAEAWETIGLCLVQGYGLTETSPILTCNAIETRRRDSPGRALDNVELRIGDEGEIQARGPCVFHEYWRNPDATRDAFTDDGWFRTGDVGQLDDGWLRIEGRLKFAIVRSSGLKVFPEDVEAVAEGEKRLQEVCVVGVAGDRGESVEAVVLGDAPDEVVDLAIASINAQLASFQHVDHWRRWPGEDFPRTRLMKVDRRQVQDWANAAGEVPAVAPAPAESGLTDPVVAAIRLSLDDPDALVHDEDRLGDLGLDSLLRLSVVSLLEELVGIAIADDAVTSATTVAELRELTLAGAPVEGVRRPPRWPFAPGVRLVGDALRDHVVFPLVHHWVDLTVEGAEHAEALGGPAIFIFNHSDDFDGPVVFQALSPRVRRRLCVAMGADVMAEHRVLAFLARLLYAAFPFARSEPYLASLQYVGEMIDQGRHVLIAPEGRLSVDGQLQPFKNGIGLLAVNLGVPVVPMKTIGLAGTVPLHAKWPRKHSRATVRIGAPMTFSAGQDYDEVTETLRRAVAGL
jgi:long-chain acyl-CoA synthetase